jgi:hypothetical protein
MDFARISSAASFARMRASSRSLARVARIECGHSLGPLAFETPRAILSSRFYGGTGPLNGVSRWEGRASSVWLENTISNNIEQGLHQCHALLTATMFVLSSTPTLDRLPHLDLSCSSYLCSSCWLPARRTMTMSMLETHNCGVYVGTWLIADFGKSGDAEGGGEAR